MTPVRIHGFAGSTYVRTARMVCEEKGIPYDLRPLEFGAASHRVLHPLLRMPVLQAGAVQLYETLAIAVYLDETGPGRPLQPASALERARMLQWVSACNDYGYARLASGADRTEAAEPAGEVLAVFDAALSSAPYLIGEQPCSPTCSWRRCLPSPRSGVSPAA
jgi:glutathione S-transferase